MAGTPVGMMAWWSVTFDVSKTRFDFVSFFPISGCMSGPYCLLMPERMDGHLG